MHRQQGVTLIELMVTVAIIGIIAAVAYPSYQSFVEKSRRADGQAALMSLAGAMERAYTVHNTYAEAASGAIPKPSVFPSEAPLDGTDKYYNLRIDTATATSFAIRAVPKNAQASDPCGDLTLDHTGSRGSDDPGNCWQ